MKDSLKKQIEELVEKTIYNIQQNDSIPRRIAIFSSKKLKEPIEILNYTENHFLNTQFKINHREIKVEVIPQYSRRYLQEGDCAVDVGDYLTINFPEVS